MENIIRYLPEGINLYILLFVIVSILYLWKRFGDDPSRSKSLPSLFTIIGVFGTFLGIVLGLADFDVTSGRVEESVSILLDGLKFAFWTSVAGIISAIAIRIKNLLSAPGDDSTDEAEKVISILQENNSLTKRIANSISSDEESSLTTQIKLLRTDYSDKTKELVTEFKAFADKQAENNINALIEAIERVIGEFNVKINEQFGDNFKRLNEAVEKLLDWQDKYYQQIEYMVNTINQTNEAVEYSKKVIEEVSEKYKDTYQLTEQFENIITTLNQENESLEQNLVNFANLAEKANGAFPIIEKRLDDLTDGFSTTVQSSLKTMGESYEKQSNETAQLMEKLRNDISSAYEETNAQLSGISSSVTEQIKMTIEQTNNEIKTQLQDVYSSSSTEFERLQRQMTDDLNTSILKIDDQLGHALTNSLNALSAQLATLSSRFVEDYQPLTERLREVVQIASSLPKPDQTQSPVNPND